MFETYGLLTCGSCHESPPKFKDDIMDPFIGFQGKKEGMFAYRTEGCTTNEDTGAFSVPGTVF